MVDGWNHPPIGFFEGGTIITDEELLQLKANMKSSIENTYRSYEKLSMKVIDI